MAVSICMYVKQHFEKESPQLKVLKNVGVLGQRRVCLAYSLVSSSD